MRLYYLYVPYYDLPFIANSESFTVLVDSQNRTSGTAGTPGVKRNRQRAAVEQGTPEVLHWSSRMCLRRPTDVSVTISRPAATLKRHNNLRFPFLSKKHESDRERWAGGSRPGVADKTQYLGLDPTAPIRSLSLIPLRLATYYVHSNVA